MFKKILVLLLFILTINLSFASSVELNAHVYSDYTIFNYIFTFDENETLNRFSLEKPPDATIDYVVDKNGPIQYEIAGDYLIVKPNKIENNVFLLKLKTESLSEEIRKTESFRTYQNFNFEVENFDFKVTLKENYGEIIDIFPINSSITENEKIEWELTNIEKSSNSLFIINFKQEIIIEETNGNYSSLFLIGAFTLIFFLIAIILVFIYPKYLKKYLKKEKNHQKEKEENSGNADKEINKIPNLDEKQESEEEAKKLKKENKFEEIIEKHLTENEKSVVKIIKEEEGITQNDILNFLPSLTKSNLSKIISKLHAKRILKRIRVGKINNIYLGEKLNPKEEKDKKQDEEEEY